MSYQKYQYTYVLCGDGEERQASQDIVRQFPHVTGTSPFFISEYNMPIGVHNIDVYVYGDWRLRNDIAAVTNLLNACSPLHFIAVQPVQFTQTWQQMKRQQYQNAYQNFQQRNPYNPSGGYYKPKEEQVIKCRIWWDETSQAYVVSSGYSEKFINALKALIPSGDRNFDPNSKFWYLKENYGEFVRKFAQDAFGIPNVSFVSKETAQQSARASTAGSRSAGAYLSPSSGGTTEDALIAFFALIPYEAAKKCYLLAAQTLHPDKPVTGDGVKMTKLNELWTRIEKEFFKR